MITTTKYKKVRNRRTKRIQTGISKTTYKIKNNTKEKKGYHTNVLGSISGSGIFHAPY